MLTTPNIYIRTLHISPLFWPKSNTYFWTKETISILLLNNFCQTQLSNQIHMKDFNVKYCSQNRMRTLRAQAGKATIKFILRNKGLFELFTFINYARENISDHYQFLVCIFCFSLKSCSLFRKSTKSCNFFYHG